METMGAPISGGQLARLAGGPLACCPAEQMAKLLISLICTRPAVQLAS